MVVGFGDGGGGEGGGDGSVIRTVHLWLVATGIAITGFFLSRSFTSP